MYPFLTCTIHAVVTSQKKIVLAKASKNMFQVMITQNQVDKIKMIVTAIITAIFTILGALSVASCIESLYF